MTEVPGLQLGGSLGVHLLRFYRWAQAGLVVLSHEQNQVLVWSEPEPGQEVLLCFTGDFWVLILTGSGPDPGPSHPENCWVLNSPVWTPEVSVPGQLDPGGSDPNILFLILRTNLNKTGLIWSEPKNQLFLLNLFLFVETKKFVLWSWFLCVKIKLFICELMNFNESIKEPNPSYHVLLTYLLLSDIKLKKNKKIKNSFVRRKCFNLD